MRRFEGSSVAAYEQLVLGLHKHRWCLVGEERPCSTTVNHV